MLWSTCFTFTVYLYIEEVSSSYLNALSFHIMTHLVNRSWPPMYPWFRRSHAGVYFWSPRHATTSQLGFNPHHLRGEERERKSKVTAIFARIEEYILFLCSVLSDLCLALSGACLSPVFSLLLAVLCQSTELKCHLIEPTVFRGWGGFAAPKQAC